MRSSEKNLLLALAVSLALHMALLPVPLPAPPEAHLPVVLEARLKEAAPPPQPLPPLAKARPAPHPRPAPPQQVATETPLVGDATVTTPAEIPLPVLPEAVPVALPPQSVASPPPPAPAAAPTTLPARAWLRFDVYKGGWGFMVGEATHTWRRDGDNYSLHSLAEARGPVSLLVSGQHLMESRGRITPSGLQPDFFLVQRGEVEKTDSARFDWETMRLNLNTEGSERRAKLIPGVRDLLSFIYQFAFFLPEHGDIRVDLTSGRKLESYRYRIVAEEDIPTPLGRLKTVHLSKLHAPGEEGTEIWLGMDYHYLPVKISHIDKDGDRYDQVVAEIRYE